IDGSHQYTEEGTYGVGAWVQDDGGAEVADGVTTATVDDVPVHVQAAPVRALEGQYFGGTVATFTDDGNPPDPEASYTATITWGDGSNPDTVALDGLGYVPGTHRYNEEGTYHVAVTVTDDGGSRAADTATATVDDAALQVSARPLHLVEGQA